MGRTAAQDLIEQGMARGIIQSKQEDLLELMKVKFHSVPKNIEDRIKTIQDIDELTSLLRRGLTAESIDKMGIG